MRRLAPNVHIESFLAKRRETTKELAAGRLDFAVDAPLNTDPQVRHVKLMEDRYVCAMRRGHPLAGKPKLALDDYLGLTHIHISSRRSASATSTWRWARWASSARSRCARSTT